MESTESIRYRNGGAEAEHAAKNLDIGYQAVAAIFVMKLTFTPAAVRLPNGELPLVVALAE